MLQKTVTLAAGTIWRMGADYDMNLWFSPITDLKSGPRRAHQGVSGKMANENWPVHGEISGPVVMIGFGSIGRGTLPLIERHFKFDKSRMTVIDPRDTDRKLLDERGIAFVQEAVTKKNYKKLLTPLLTKGGGQGFCVNLSVDTGSVDLMRLCRKLGVLYIDTVVEPWLGFYFDATADNASRTNYALRESLLEEKHKKPGGTTAISTCGANPGMVSWFVKQALVNLATDLGMEFSEPAQDDREGWAKLMKKAGVKGIHIAERDTQRTKKPKPMNAFWNTWSVEGFISEGLQPAELGWGTHEKWMPEEWPQAQARARRQRSISNSPAPTHGCAAGVRRQARNMASLSPTTRRYRSPISSPSARKRARFSTARPATTPTTRATTPYSRCTRFSAPRARRRRLSMC